MRLHKTLVKPVLLYRCETWKMKKWDDRTVDVYMFHNKCLRRILQFQWQEHVSTRELLERADIKPMSEEVKQRRWKMMEYYYTKTGQNDDCSIEITWAPEGKRIGRSKTTWGPNG